MLELGDGCLCCLAKYLHRTSHNLLTVTVFRMCTVTVPLTTSAFPPPTGLVCPCMFITALLCFSGTIIVAGVAAAGWSSFDIEVTNG